MDFTFYDLIFILCLIYKYAFLTNASSLLRKAILSSLGKVGKQTESIKRSGSQLFIFYRLNQEPVRTIL